MKTNNRELALNYAERLSGIYTAEGLVEAAKTIEAYLNEEQE